MGIKSFFKRINNKNNEVNEDIDDSHIKINRTNCKGVNCQKCINACPNNVLFNNGDKTYPRNSFACKRCKICQSICPNKCILVE